jgi:hypothetical protein
VADVGQLCTPRLHVRCICTSTTGYVCPSLTQLFSLLPSLSLHSRSHSQSPSISLLLSAPLSIAADAIIRSRAFHHPQHKHNLRTLASPTVRVVQQQQCPASRNVALTLRYLKGRHQHVHPLLYSVMTLRCTEDRRQPARRVRLHKSSLNSEGVVIRHPAGLHNGRITMATTHNFPALTRPYSSELIHNIISGTVHYILHCHCTSHDRMQEQAG